MCYFAVGGERLTAEHCGQRGSAEQPCYARAAAGSSTANVRAHEDRLRPGDGSLRRGRSTCSSSAPPARNCESATRTNAAGSPGSPRRCTSNRLMISEADPELCEREPNRVVRHEVVQLLDLAALAGAQIPHRSTRARRVRRGSRRCPHVAARADRRASRRAVVSRREHPGDGLGDRRAAGRPGAGRRHVRARVRGRRACLRSDRQGHAAVAAPAVSSVGRRFRKRPGRRNGSAPERHMSQARCGGLRSSLSNTGSSG